MCVTKQIQTLIDVGYVNIDSETVWMGFYCCSVVRLSKCVWFNSLGVCVTMCIVFDWPFVVDNVKMFPVYSLMLQMYVFERLDFVYGNI